MAEPGSCRLAAAVLSKLYPLLLAPAVLVFVWRSSEAGSISFIWGLSQVCWSCWDSPLSQVLGQTGSSADCSSMPTNGV